MKDFFKIITAVMVGLVVMAVAIAWDASDGVAIAAYVGAGIGVAAVFGVFDVPERNARQRKLRRDYRDAA